MAQLKNNCPGTTGGTSGCIAHIPDASSGRKDGRNESTGSAGTVVEDGTNTAVMQKHAID